jgi:hypothetical protein
MSANPIDETLLEDFILEPEDYDLYLTDQFYDTHTVNYIEIKCEGGHLYIDTVDEKRLVVRARVKKGEQISLKLLKVFQDISESEQGLQIYNELQKKVDNLETFDNEVIYDLVHYHYEGCGSDDWWKII